jgi:hypothetical protein
VVDVLKCAHDVNVQVKDLDDDMQMIAYENYSKFIRATDVTKLMKTTIDGLEPDLKSIQTNIGQIADKHRKLEDMVLVRANKIEALLKQQRLCEKIRMLFGLPTTLQKCLDRRAYGQATMAYSSCVPFLRQYSHISSFRQVLEDVELQMGQIRTALEQQLRSSELSVQDAVSSSITLLDLGADRPRVATDFLAGRGVALQECLSDCFADDFFSEPGEELNRACAAATEKYLPMLCDAVEGFQRLPESRSAKPGTANQEAALSDFVSVRIESFFERTSGLVEKCKPQARVLVSCVDSVKDALRRLHSLMPRLLTKLFTSFLGRIACTTVKSLFSAAATAAIADLQKLHGTCKALQESKNVNLDAFHEVVVNTEGSVLSHGFTALEDCQPLLGLLGSERAACQQLCRELHEQLFRFFLTFATACNLYLGKTAAEASSFADASLLVSGQILIVAVDAFAELEWVGLFGLSLVSIGRHFEEKAIGRMWTVVKDFFANSEQAVGEVLPAAALVKAVESTLEALLTHYVLISGQRLAHFFRNSVQTSRKKWMQAKEPQEPSLVVEMVLKEVVTFDAQLARVLGDPRKPRGTTHNRNRVFNRNKNSMELEMDRLWAKKLQVFAPILLNRNSAIMGILRIAFKSLFEYVREETMGKFGLQQLQLDCALLIEVSRDFVSGEDATSLESLLGEVVNSASQRCIEPVLMEADALEMLCDEKKRVLRFE